MPTNYITLTRQELYDMVWAKLMSSLANGFSITDFALAKRCRAVDVPIPYRGYWARKAAGQVPPQTSLSNTRTRPCSDDRAIATAPEPTVHFGLPSDRPSLTTQTSSSLSAEE